VSHRNCEVEGNAELEWKMEDLMVFKFACRTNLVSVWVTFHSILVRE
jgi:hypothetical protein